MKSMIFSILFLLAGTVQAAESFTLKTSVTTAYTLTNSGFVSSPENESWKIVFSNNTYYLSAKDVAIPLNVLQSDENSISLQQPVLFSGTRIFTFFRKTKTFIFQETGYSSFPELQKRAGRMPELVNISFGTFIIE